MAAQVNSVLKNRKSKDTITFERYSTADDAKKAQAKKARKKPGKKATTKKPKQVTVNSTEYGYSIPAYGLLGLSMLGDRVPDDLEGQVEFWKKKYEQSLNQSSKLTSQVTLLQSIIDKALTRSCSGSC